MSDQERAKELYRQMNVRQKAGYLVSYYRLPFFCILLVACMAFSIGWTVASRKEPVLYAAFVNVALDGEEETEVTKGYLEERKKDSKKEKIEIYQNLYLTEEETSDQGAAYASMIKLMGSLETKKLDVVVMDRRAYKIIHKNGYLKEIEKKKDYIKKGQVYYGIAQNSPRAGEALKYIQYLTSAAFGSNSGR